MSKTKQLLRKISNSNRAISVVENSTSSSEVTIGSFKEINSSGGGFSMPMGGGSIATPGGVVSLPVTYSNPYYFGYSQSTLSKSAFFSSVFDIQSIKHLPEAEVDLSPWDQIKKHENSLGAASETGDDIYSNKDYFIPKVSTVYRIDDKYLFGYFNSKKKEYVVKYFELNN